MLALTGLHTTPSFLFQLTVIQCSVCWFIIENPNKVSISLWLFFFFFCTTLKKKYKVYQCFCKVLVRHSEKRKYILAFFLYLFFSIPWSDGEEASFSQSDALKTTNWSICCIFNICYMQTTLYNRKEKKKKGILKLQKQKKKKNGSTKMEILRRSSSTSNRNCSSFLRWRETILDFD